MNSTDQLCNFEAAQIPEPQPNPHGEQKRQVRRRRQSRRLYKEMPLNMAEARREIVTALKLHRASTKEAKKQQQQQDQQIKQSFPLFSQLLPCFEPEGRMKSRRNPRIYPGCSFYLENGSDFSHVAPSCPIIAPPPVAQSLNMDIPIQTLGLNLNFGDDFKTVDTCPVVCDNSHSFCSVPLLPSSSYICPPVSYGATHQEVPKSISLSEEEGKLMASDVFWLNNVPTGESEKEMQGAVDEEAMAEIRSMDVKALEIDGQCSFDKAMEFPDWLSINDDFLQQHSNYHCAEKDYLQDPDLFWYEFNFS